MIVVICNIIVRLPCRIRLILLNLKFKVLEQLYQTKISTLIYLFSLEIVCHVTRLLLIKRNTSHIGRFSLCLTIYRELMLFGSAEVFTDPAPILSSHVVYVFLAPISFSYDEPLCGIVIINP